MTKRYLEDYHVGQTFGSSHLLVDKAQIVKFASEFDPQPFHMDDEAANDSFFGGLAASGWHTAAITMKLLVGSDLNPAGGIVGAGLDEFRWPRPVRPGDELHLEIEVLEVRPSKSHPERGMLKLSTTTLNQDNDAVQFQIVNLVVPCRPVQSLRPHANSPHVREAQGLSISSEPLPTQSKKSGPGRLRGGSVSR